MGQHGLALDTVLARASSSVEAHLANTAIYDERAAQEAMHGRAVVFEALAGQARDLGWLTGDVLPRLTYHLRAKKLRAPRAPGAVVALFVDLRLYFLDAQALYAVVSELAGWSEADLAARIARWEETLE